jgi:hypothetical protein
MKHVIYEAPTYAAEVNDGAYYPRAWVKLDRHLKWERERRVCLLKAVQSSIDTVREEAARLLWELYRVKVGKQ